jgi:hypothetical protein
MHDETLSAGELGERQDYTGRRDRGSGSAEPDVLLDVPQLQLEAGPVFFLLPRGWPSRTSVREIHERGNWRLFELPACQLPTGNSPCTRVSANSSIMLRSYSSIVSILSPWMPAMRSFAA